MYCIDVLIISLYIIEYFPLKQKALFLGLKLLKEIELIVEDSMKK